MKNYSLRKIILSVGQSLVIGLLSLTVACKDEPARLSGDVLPEGEMIKGLNYDGHELMTQNVMRESVRTSDASYGILGKFNDPLFGSSEAGFLTDFSIGKKVYFSIEYIDADGEEQDTVLYQFNNTNITDFPNDEWRVDSLMLNLQYQFNNWYGDMTHPQKVNVYELSTSLGSISQKYYSDHDVTGMYDPIAVASEVLYPNNEVPDTLRSTNWANLYQYTDSLWNYPQYLWDMDKVGEAIDSSWLDNDFSAHTTKTKTWSLKMNDELTNRFYNLTENDLNSTGAFKNVFNGVYVALDEMQEVGNGWLNKINLLSTSSSVASNLTLHLSRDYKYLNSLDELRDTTVSYAYQFPINLENVRFNKYTHVLDDTNIDIEDVTPERVYIQGMAGSYMKMQLPDEILNWADSIKNPAVVEPFTDEDYRMVANVEFYMEIDTVASEMDRYPVPDQLVIKWANEKGELVDPYYTIEKNGNTITTPVFGGDTESDGSRKGIGERVVRLSDEDRPEYLYRFIMRSDFFNYIMRNQDGASLNEKEFYIGPVNTTSNFQRVVLFGGANTARPMKMNIKYYHYRPR